MNGKKSTSNSWKSNYETIEMRPKRDKPTSEAQPFASPHHNVDSSYADGEDNGHKTTDDTQPAYKPHEIHYENVPCHPRKDVAKLPKDVAKLPDDKTLVVQDLLPPEPIQLTTSEEFKSVEDTSNLAERNGQATNPPAVNKFVRPRNGVICVVHQNKRYILNSMNEYLLQLPRATAYFTLDDRGDVETFTLHCSSEGESPNLDAMEGAIVIVGEHFHCNANRPGYTVYSSDSLRFSGDIQYLLPKKNAEDDRIGIGTSTQSFVFTIFHKRKEYAVKKTVYRPEDINVYSRLHHRNIVYLEAVLIGLEHEHLRNRFYAYHFMTKMSVNLKQVLVTNQDGCLEYYTGKEQWGLVLYNIKRILKGVLEAMKYMHFHGVVLRDIKASNVLLNMDCPCVSSDVLLCCCQTFDVKLSLSSSMVASYDSLYADGMDARLFGHFLLDILTGKSAQGFEDAQDVYYTNCLLNELERCYSDSPELCGLVCKCFQVGVIVTAEDLLQLKFFN